MDRRALCDAALEAARSQGASYADARIVSVECEDLAVVNGALNLSNLSEDRGIGVRVIVDGQWGFASTPTLEADAVAAVAARACAIARAGASAGVEPVRLSPAPSIEDVWCTPVLLDPFAVSLEDRLALLFAVDEELRRDARIVRSLANLSLLRERQAFATSEGSWIIQELIRTGAGCAATAAQDGEVQVRSYPMSFGGDYKTGGYEVVLAMDLVGKAPQVREEAIALTTAPECPSGARDLILMPGQLCLQIHESVGHPNELDRVFGWEADFAGHSFVTPEMRGEFQYGSPLVNLVADNTVPGGLATAGYDDDGIPAQRWHVVQNGLYKDPFTTRDTAPLISKSSNGCNRAMGWSHVPITRIPNLSLMPGEHSLEEIIADTDDGVLMDTNKSWSIDQHRLNFQFGCEIAWEVKGGKRGRMLRNPNYQDMTPRFWRSCDRVGDHASWQLIGVANCGKGQPGQRAEMSHGCSPARFRGVTIGVRAR